MYGNPKEGALYLPIVDQVVHNFFHQVGGHGKTISRINPGRRGNGSVYAYQVAIQIHQGAPAVAGLMAASVLDKRFDGGYVFVDVDVSSFGTLQSRGHGGFEVEKGCPRPVPIPYLGTVRIAYGHRGRPWASILSGQIGVGVGAHHIGIEGAVVVEGNFQFGRIGHHMVVGNDVPIRPDDDP